MDENSRLSHRKEKILKAPTTSGCEIQVEGLCLGDDSDIPLSSMKQIFTDCDGDRLEKILEQKLKEYRGELVFKIGVEESGESMNMTSDECTSAFELTKQCADRLNADVGVLNTQGMEDDKSINFSKNSKKFPSMVVMIRRRVVSAQDSIEIRVACVGNVDSGKSTMLGVLTKGDLDDGRGKARVNLFRHKHEIESGRTSSVGMEIMGFDSCSKPVVSGVRKMSWEEVSSRSAKVISFFDLAGHEKYLKTTVFGLCGYAPDYVMLMIGANAGLTGMSKEHLGIALALQVPIFVIITKIDMTPPNVLEETIKQLTKILKSSGVRKIPLFVKSKDDAILAATHSVGGRVCPVFSVSNVTGEGVDYVKSFLNILPANGQFFNDDKFEVQISDVFNVPFVGCVVSGVVNSGIVKTIFFLPTFLYGPLGGGGRIFFYIVLLIGFILFTFIFNNLLNK